MPLTAILSNHFKYQLAKKQIDLSADNIIVCLMRQNFSFNKDTYAKRANFRTNTGAISVTFSASNQTITRTSGSFISDGFVVGNRITTDSSLNPGPFIITNVTNTVITVATGITNEGPITKTISSDDELPTGNGYTQYNKALTEKILIEDNTFDRAEMTCDDVIWNASGGAIGPTPGALLVDDTTSDKTVIGYLDFGGDQQAPSGTQFSIIGIRIRIT